MKSPTLEFHGVNGLKLYIPIGFRADATQPATPLRLTHRQLAAALLPHDEYSTARNARPLKLDLGLAPKPRQPAFPGWSNLILAFPANRNRVARQKPDQVAIHPAQFRVSQIELLDGDGVSGFLARAGNGIADFIAEAFDKFRRLATGKSEAFSQLQNEKLHHEQAGGKFYVCLAHVNSPLCGMKAGDIRPINAALLQRWQAAANRRAKQGKALVCVAGVAFLAVALWMGATS